MSFSFFFFFFFFFSPLLFQRVTQVFRHAAGFMSVETSTTPLSHLPILYIFIQTLNIKNLGTTTAG